MKSLRRLSPIGVALLALSAPVAASARPPQAVPSSAPPPASLTAARGTVVQHPLVARVSSLPASARAQRWYVLHAVVVNGRSVAVHASLTAHLLRVDSRPLAIGRAAVLLHAHASSRVSIRVHLPRLRAGSYALVACMRRSGGAGALDCITAERHLQIGARPPASRPRLLAFADPAACSSGARSLSPYGAHVYPETGNGGYTSVHSDVFLSYDAGANRLLPGTHVALTDLATQCLSDFSLDFERTSPNTKHGPSLSVSGVLVNGQPAAFRFVQPTYPGDPNGWNDPDPAAHEAGQLNPVGGPAGNPLPPACSPELLNPDPSLQFSLDGTQCPANKLVITPSTPIANGSTFTVEVDYTGHPGVHNDGDGTTEGWFVNGQPNDAGSFVTTEPVGSEDWMPLNDHPSSKPTYDFYDTVPAGKTAIGNGELVSQQSNAPDAEFPSGSKTWHWHSPEGVASYLVENSIGSYDLSERLAPSGIQYYEAQDTSIRPRHQAMNKKIMDMQEGIVDFQSGFNGPFPFTTDGVIVGIPRAGFEEEMQTKITFQGGRIDLEVLHHENMHQWWGDNVSEANYNLTFYKEGMAMFGEFLFIAANAQAAAGGDPAAFEQSLVDSFNHSYRGPDALWTGAPSDPRPSTLFSGARTYLRPGIGYIALRLILGPANFASALQAIQQRYRQGSITEPQLESAFAQYMPDQSPACTAKLSKFFSEWWDTTYAPGGGANRPQITGPGLHGDGFHC
jgi:hypothetical protein